ncbi:MAG: phosphate ABC transporter permease PstA [Candidatus Delongbacteria bacterium]|jgi:phosphate transport system permease protein|nr:phosphate ABC transporter permease PstA [Candidatus Delongbacteria bacterium]
MSTKSLNIRVVKEFFGISALKILTFITAALLFIFIYIIVSKGYSVISWEFVSESPRRFMTEGGIFPAIVGTFWLTIISVTIALPFGVFTAVYLTSYAKPYWFVKSLRITISTLAAIPSIIYGLFGMAIFVVYFNFDVSILSGSLTLAVLVLPIIINNTEEALKTIPSEFRDASLSLGASERQTILRVLLPAALPNILTGVILAIGRVAGETAPILFTAATFYTRHLPSSLSDEVMALPYHIYALMTEGSHPDKQVPIAYGTALVLLGFVLIVSSSAIYFRYRIRKNRDW